MDNLEDRNMPRSISVSTRDWEQAREAARLAQISLREWIRQAIAGKLEAKR